MEGRCIGPDRQPSIHRDGPLEPRRRCKSIAVLASLVSEQNLHSLGRCSQTGLASDAGFFTAMHVCLYA